MARRATRRTGRSAAVLGTALAVCAIVVAGASATHGAIDTEGHTTLEQVVTGDGAAGYETLGVEATQGSYFVRDGAAEESERVPNAPAGRESRRSSLAYFAQMTDFQLADEESPARVEFLDPQASSAWRPQEAFVPFMVDATIRQVNALAEASPVTEGDGTRSAMDFALMTGDQADNQQRNETAWVRDLLEGGRPLVFGSGATDPDFYTSPGFESSAGCLALLAQHGGDVDAVVEEARQYTGVQDADDYPEAGGGQPQRYWDPDAPAGSWAGWPTYPGLMDRANQIVFTPEGLSVPFYLTNGNHDVLAQGNEDANQGFERVATSCEKALATPTDPSAGSLEDFFANPSSVMLVPPDPQRQYVSKTQIKEIYGETTADDDDHGYGLVDPDEEEASNDSASYYAWDPAQTPGIRFVSIDTTSEGGVVGPFSGQPVETGSSDGNIDDPQFEWLTDELDAAQAAGKLIVVFGHHPIRSLDSIVPDEAAAQCSGDDPHGHDVNPGCDIDPRNSEPLHLGDPEEAAALGSSAKTIAELFAEYPNVLAYIPGHTHENRVTAYPKGGDSVFWELNTSAVLDHPTQSRLIEIFDNGDATLSIFGTIIDHASPGTPPAPDTSAAALTAPELGSIGRSVAYNDPQTGQRATTDEEGEIPPTGFARDQNVELLQRDVRIAPLPGRGEPFPAALRCAGKDATIIGTTGRDVIKGTKRNDVIVTGPGKDKVKASRGKDVVCGGEGNDRLRGNRGRDVLKGGKGDDKLFGGKGNDRLTGGKGDDRGRGGGGRDKVSGGKDDDRLNGGRGRDRIAGGAGDDVCRVKGKRDRVGRKGCETIVGRGRG